MNRDKSSDESQADSGQLERDVRTPLLSERGAEQQPLAACPVCKREVEIHGRFYAAHRDNANNWCMGYHMKAF